MSTAKLEIKTIKPEVEAMSAIIQKGITIDAKAQTVEAAPDLYEKTLPEGLTMDTVDAVRSHNTTFVAAGTHAMGTMAVQAMAKDKTIDRLTVGIGMGGKDSLELATDRKRVTIDQMHNKGAEIVKYGVTTATLTNHAGKNSGQLKVARAQISQMAMELLNK